jgi:diguanylate cyclase (GGDEF)-like protein
MSFRARLRLFFVLIVIVPMLSVALLLFRLISDNETGKTDSDIHARQHAAIQMFGEARAASERAVEGVGNDRVLAAALRDGDIARARRRAAQIERSSGIARIALSRGTRVLFDVGDRTAIAPGQRNLHGTSGRRFGLLETSMTTAAEYARDVQRIAGAEVLVRRGGRTLASTLPVAPASIPRPRDPRNVEVDAKPYRAVTFRTGPRSDFLGTRDDLVILAPADNRDSRVGRSRLLAGGILLGFLLLALTFALAVSRSLQAQIGAFLQAARRLGGGDFSTDVPTPGHDEFAELGEEFNKMSRQLAERLEQLREQRGRLESSLRRIGESFASNLDRDALLEIVVRTAVEGVEAEGGRVCLRPGADEPLEERARAGDLTGLADAIHAAEEEVLVSGAAADVRINELHALAHPLHGANGTGEVHGLVSVARRSSDFDEAERELFGYLAAQAAVSIENVGLHETVQRQAVTDELTGLYNHRRFQEAMDAEAERAKRFGQDMGLVMLDIDNFKQVNDTYGHQQGDVVLAEVARIVRESSREIDAPARYGGEELAVVLPGTDIEGAYNLAERMRHGIEDLAFPLADGRGELRVTASLGVASMPRSATDPRELLARADAALYEAKRSGKNKVVRAG